MREAKLDPGGQVLEPPTATLPQAEDLFMEGPPMLVEAKLGFLRPGRLYTARRCAIFILLTWAPLALLTALEGTLMPRADGIAFLADVGALARSWIAGPLLLAADFVAGRELSQIAARFGWLAALSPSARDGFARVVASTLRLRDGLLLEVAVVASVLLLVLGLINSATFDMLPVWHHSGVAPHKLSMAGWWYALVSLPLLLVLVVGWLWRLVLWTRFLLLVSRLDLAIVPEHPDRAGGMGFIGYSVRGFALVAAAFAAIVAGAMANKVLHDQVPLPALRYTVLVTVVACVVLFCAPLFAFAKRLAAERRRGLRQFGQLSTSFGLRFAEEWFRPGRRIEADALERQDFSAATDLYQVVDRVQAMRFVPVDRVNVMMLAGAALVPFVPVAFLAIPFDTLMTKLLGILV
jgi:hypothetical protein